MTIRFLLLLTTAAASLPGCQRDRPVDDGVHAFTPRNRITIHIPDDAFSEPTSGRLVLWFIRKDAQGLEDTDPASGPFLDNPQPIMGADLTDVAAGESIDVPGPRVAVFDLYGKIEPGDYRVHAVFDWRALDSNWAREPGNLHSEVVELHFPDENEPPLRAELELSNTVEPQTRADAPGLEWVAVRSDLLSTFRKTDVTLRAGVVFPQNYDPNRRYSAVYFVPGFGGDDRFAAGMSRMRDAAEAQGPMIDLLGQAFLFMLNPESPNGHSLFADSAVNGPWGRALVEELIPALEARYPIIADPSGRIVRGHSSGGWSAVWLPLAYPETFGHGFASSPDPIDFHAFQESNIYADNFYFDAKGELIGSNIRRGQATTSIRQENLLEEAVAPNNASGQQWDSWLGVFGPRGKDGNPANLFDPFTGKINQRIARKWKKLDIGWLLRQNPQRYGPIFRDRIRIIVGDADQWSLHKAVELVKDDLEELGFDTSKTGEHDGYISILSGYDHGSIFGAPEMNELTHEMVRLARQANQSHQ